MNERYIKIRCSNENWIEYVVKFVFKYVISIEILQKAEYRPWIVMENVSLFTVLDGWRL